MEALFSQRKFDCVVDATHPYAPIVTGNLRAACEAAGTEYLRLLRGGSGLPENCVYADSTAQAAEKLAELPGNILLTTGSKELKTFSRLPDFAQRVYARVLPVEESIAACREAGLPWAVVPEQTLDGQRVSSTRIRQVLEAGDMAGAARLLGHPYVLRGEVLHGRGLGHRLGFPTANLAWKPWLLRPKAGVYVCRATVGESTFPAVTNIGTRPTVQGHEHRAESWLLGFTGDLYGRELVLEFYDFLREERKFESLEALKAQIFVDAEKTKAFFG